MSYHADTSENLLPNTPSHLNSVLYYEDPIIMPVLVNNQNGEQSMARATSDQLYPPGYFTNLLNDNDNQSFDMGSSFSFPILHRRPSEYRPSVNHLPFDAAVPLSMDEPLPSTEDFTGMPAMPRMPTAMTTQTPQWSMPSGRPTLVMASTAGMPFGWTTGPPNLIAPGPPPMPVSTKPNMRKRTTTGLGPATRTPTKTSGPANVLDEHHPKPEGAYYPPTKRIKRELVETPQKPSWAASSRPEDGSVVFLPRPPLVQPLQVTPQPAAEQSAANSGRKSSSGVSSSTYDSTYDSPSDVSPPPPSPPSSSPSSSPSPAAAAAPATPRPAQPPVVHNPSPPIIPRPLEPFPEAGTIMNFPLPQIDHQGQRPAAAERYFSSLQDDFLFHAQDSYEIEMEYRNALRVRERVDWDCRRLGLRLRYLRRCQARAAERYPTARECEWQRGDFGEQAAGYGY